MYFPRLATVSTLALRSPIMTVYVYLTMKADLTFVWNFHLIFIASHGVDIKLDDLWFVGI